MSRGGLVSSVCLLALVLLNSIAFLEADDGDRQALGEPRKEDKWEVTPLGECHDCSYQPYFAKQNRLLIAVDNQPPQLWDTKSGKRIAIWSDQKNGADSCDISPDGTRLLTADRLGGRRLRRDKDEKNDVRSLWMWDLESGKLLKQFEIEFPKEVRGSTDWHVRWLDKDTILVSLDWRKNPARASSGTILGRLDLTTGNVEKWSEPLIDAESLQCSANGKRAVAGRDYGLWRADGGGIGTGGLGTTFETQLVDLVNLKLIAKLDHEQPGGKERTIVDRYWSSDSRWAATVGNDHTVRIWDGDTGTAHCSLVGHEDWILDVAFTPDGKTVVTASNDETVRLWDVASGRKLQVLNGHTAGLNSVVFDSRGERVLSGGEDETARIWDVATGKQLRAWGKHESAVREVGFEDGDKKIWTRTAQGIRRVWSLEDGSLVEQNTPASRNSNRFGVLYLKSTKDDLLEVWSGPPGVPGEDSDRSSGLKPRFTFHGDSHYFTAAITLDGKTAASPGKDHTVCIWDLEHWDKVTGDGRTSLASLPAGSESMAFAPDGKSLAVACTDGSLKVWDLAAKKPGAAFEGDAANVRSLTFSPDGKLLAAVKRDRILLVWDVATGKLKINESETVGQLRAVVFSPDSKFVASAGQARDPDGKDIKSFYTPGEIILWDIATGKPTRTLTHFKTAVWALTFTPDGKELITGGLDKEITIWNLETGQTRATLKVGKESVDYLAVSPDGKLLVSSHDSAGNIEVWDVASAKEIGRSRCLSGKLMFTPDGESLITPNARVRVWDVAELRKSLEKQ